MFKGYYINLDRNVERRSRYESMLQQIGASERYERFAAVDGKAAQATHPTKLDPGNLGCWLSHLSILEANRNGSVDLHITEDDAILPPGVLPLIDGALATANRAAPGWDLMFTNSYVSADLKTFLAFSSSVATFRKTGNLDLVNLKSIEFASTSSYLVNEKSVSKILSVLHDGWKKGLPIDLFIREQVCADGLNALLWAPFLTSISSDAQQSDIRGKVDRSRAVLDILRRGFYCQADLPQLTRELQAVTQNPAVDDLSALYMEVIRFIVSGQYERF